MSATERVINNLNIAKLILCNPQTLTPETCVRIGQAINSAIDLLTEQGPKTILDIADPIDGIEVGKCPRCERTILKKQSDPTGFCKYCGQAVKWNAID